MQVQINGEQVIVLLSWTTRLIKHLCFELWRFRLHSLSPMSWVKHLLLKLDDYDWDIEQNFNNSSGLLLWKSTDMKLFLQSQAWIRKRFKNNLKQ